MLGAGRLSLASISTPDIPLTPVAIAGAPGFSRPGISHCCPLAYPVLKELNTRTRIPTADELQAAWVFGQRCSSASPIVSAQGSWNSLS
jgi:hypothetical protein